MNHLRHALRIVSLGSLLVLGACGMAPMASTSTARTARLSGASEVPTVMTNATGIVESNLTPGSNELTSKNAYSGLGGPAAGAHFHDGPAMAGQNAGAVVPIGVALASPITGSAPQTPSQAAYLAAGKWNVNLRTATNPNGEPHVQVGVGP